MTIPYHHTRDARIPDVPSRWRLGVIAAMMAPTLCAAACQPRAESSGAARAELPPGAVSPLAHRLMVATAHGDAAPLRAHGWEIWRDLQGRWQRFERADVVFGQRDRIFRGQRPFRHGDVIEAETEPVMFTVAFDPTAAEHIRRNHLASSRHLRTLTKVPAFPRS